jgi:hypothetical protein
VRDRADDTRLLYQDDDRMARRRDALVEPIQALANRLRIEGASSLSEAVVKPLSDSGTELVSPALLDALQEVADSSWGACNVAVAGRRAVGGGA